MKNKNGAKKKPIKVIVTVLIIIVAVFALLLIGISAGEKLVFSSFYKQAVKEFDMPGMSSGFVGQGLDYWEEQDAFIACGYSAKKGEASMVYYVGADGKMTCTKLKKSDGSNYKGHTGGIAHYKEYFYITGSDGCDVFALDDLINGNGESKMLGEVKTFMDPAYCNVRGGKFYTGSFYRKGNYETPDWQRITTPAGDKNTAVITVFDIDDSLQSSFYISPEPTAVYSTCGLVQGLTFMDNQMVLSTSYALASSHFYFYDISGIVGGQIELNGKNLPLYYLDSSNLKNTVTVPPMSEEIVYKDGKIYIMCESASNKYIFGKFTSGRSLWSWKVN